MTTGIPIMVWRRLTTFAVAAFLGSLGHGATARPNILIILADDLGYADAGFQGCRDIPTPNLDALAASGVRCSSGYVSGPYCSPSRAALLTGRYQNRFGFEFIPFHPPAGLPASERTMGDRLQAAGYRTGLVGKWHVGLGPECHPLKRGFDEFFGFRDGAHSYFEASGLEHNAEPVQTMDYTTDAFGREAVAFIDRHKDRAWFLLLSFNAVHKPMEATPERLARFAHIQDVERRIFAAMTVALDDAIGMVRQKLVEVGMATNTLVFFLSDNGGPIPSDTSFNGARNGPLRGGKRTTLEGGIRVPFVVSWPGRLKPGVYDRPVIQLDLTATALAAAGVKAKLDGVNILPYLAGQKRGDPHKALYWRFGKQMAIRRGDYKLVRYDSNADTGTGKFNQPIIGPRLYNLADDMGETRDLSAEQPRTVNELQAKWDKWNKGNIRPAWPSAHEKDDGYEAPSASNSPNRQDSKHAQSK